jgi:hypothetical protein
VENYKKRFGFYPAKVLADQIYCTRENRKWLKDKNIQLAAKLLGRPSAKAVAYHVRPGERNPIEGKFGQPKNAYGMNRIRARLKKHQPIVDRLHHPSAETGQTGRDGTGVSGFFSMEEGQLPVFNWHKRNL